MNLVSYEFVACQGAKKGVLILSEVSVKLHYFHNKRQYFSFFPSITNIHVWAPSYYKAIIVLQSLLLKTGIWVLHATDYNDPYFCIFTQLDSCFLMISGFANVLEAPLYASLFFLECVR